MQYYRWRFKSLCKRFLRRRQNTKSKRTYTLHFWKFSEWYTKKRIKNPLEIGYQHFKRSLNFIIFVVKYQSFTKIFDQMACLKIYLVRRWLTSKTKKNLNKTFLKNDFNIKFRLWYLKVFSNIKTAMHCFENFWGGKCPKCPPPWLRACCIEYIFFIIQNFEQVALVLKNSLPWKFSLHWNIFYLLVFLRNLGLPQGGLRLCRALGWDLERGSFYIYETVVNRGKN